jgi:hypothetical protein
VIWRANQPDAAEESVDLTAGGRCLDVWRAGDEVVFRVLPPAAWAFRQALIQGHRLVEAATRALTLDPGFDLGEALGTLLEDGVLTGFTSP